MHCYRFNFFDNQGLNPHGSRGLNGTAGYVRLLQTENPRSGIERHSNRLSLAFIYSDLLKRPNGALLWRIRPGTQERALRHKAIKCKLQTLADPLGEPLMWWRILHDTGVIIQVFIERVVIWIAGFLEIDDPRLVSRSVLCVYHAPPSPVADRLAGQALATYRSSVSFYMLCRSVQMLF